MRSKILGLGLDAVGAGSNGLVTGIGVDRPDGRICIRAICIAPKPAWFRIQAFRAAAAECFLDIKSDRRLQPQEALVLDGPCPDVTGVRWSVPRGYENNFQVLVFDWVGSDGSVHPQLFKPGRV